jgi:outer membrane protein OmpA-like peptidoglycan-associated protein
MLRRQSAGFGSTAGFLLVALLFLSCPTVGPASAVSLAPGTTIFLRTLETIKSNNAKVGQGVPLVVDGDVVVDGVVAIAAKTPVSGEITEAHPAGLVGAAGEVGFVVQTIPAVDGTAIPVYGARFRKGESRLPAAAATTVFFGLGLLIHGGEAVIEAGSVVEAKVAALAELKPAPDADHDGVIDSEDEQPDTPAGAVVDRHGRSIDSDGDRVPDGIDQDNNTPPGTPVDQWGIADTDHDGVNDRRDTCPNTPADYLVDASGCPQLGMKRVQQFLNKGRITETRIYFETGSATLLRESDAVLDTIGATLSQFPSLRVQVGGHCDDRGDDEFNQRLSEERAAAVVTYLVSKNPGLSADRLSTKGFGRTQPLSQSTDDASRARNRRVEFQILNMEDVSTVNELKDYLRRGQTVPDSTRAIDVPGRSK